MQHLNIEIREGVATLVLNRPARRNALSPALIEELVTAFSDVHQEKRVRSVILGGAGPDFCSGLDLQTCGEIAAMPEADAIPEWFEYWRRVIELFETMLRFPKPIIAAVDGSAIGAGMGLTMASDLVVASDRARFSAEAVRRGLVGGATAALLAFRLGGAFAARLLIGGEQLTAAQFHAAGGCGPLVGSDQVWERAMAVAQHAALGSPEAIQATKRVLNEGIGEHLMTQLSAGAAGSATACTTESAAEGVRAFLEKRDPLWP